MTVEGRETGWLDERWHGGFREILLHTAARYGLLCPVYCAMPDHLHLICAGAHEDADQLPAMQFFRKHTNGLLRPRCWQRQGYDNVLTADDRKAEAFKKICAYILDNPVRAGLTANWEDYPFSATMIPGYPTVSPRQPDYWDLFWQIHGGLLERGGRRG